MDQPRSVGGRQSLAGLDVSGEDVFEGAGLAHRIGPLSQRAPGQQLHRDEHPAVHVPDVVHRDDVRMGQPGEGLCLPQQSRVRLGGQVGVGAQQLERDLAVQLGVVGGIDHPGRSGAQAVEDHEAADPGRILGIGEQAPLHRGEHRLAIEGIGLHRYVGQASPYCLVIGRGLH